MDLKETINSVLIYGDKSPQLNCFVRICASIAVSCLNNSRFKKEIITNMNHSVEDIAVDLIGDLFKTENKKFIYIENFFSGIDVVNTEEDILKAKLSSLIYNRSNQRISKIRIEFGEKFFNIEKAVNEEIHRHPDVYKQFMHNGNIFIYVCDKTELDESKPMCSEDDLLYYLFGKKYKTAETPEILGNVFEFMNMQNDFIKAYGKTPLASLVTKFHRKRCEGNN